MIEPFSLLSEYYYGGYYLRLSGGRQSGNIYEGRVEVFYQNTWGTVCDRGWNDFSAQAVCNMLGWR